MKALPGVAALGAIAALSAIGALPTQAQDSFSYPGCPDVSVADLRKVSLVDKQNHPALNEPLKMAVAKDGRLFFVERMGKVKLWEPASKAVTELATLPVFSNHEQGLIGIALDPLFASNRWIYINRSVQGVDAFRVSRFTLNAGKLDIATEKVIIDIAIQRRTCCHTGGDLAFDAQGNLYVSTGNNINNGSYVDESNPDLDDQGHSANTNDLRGKILRIKPKALPDGGTGAAPAPGVGSTYDIPPGNLFVAGTALTRPEIYTMGHRNPYTISVDPKTGWVSYGDIGPDNGWDTEEHSQVTAAGNMGWPYFAGSAGHAHYKYTGDRDPAAPANNSPHNTGLKVLPPAVPALAGYRQSAAITGPIYRYDPALDSKVKLPPHFDGKWFVTDFNVGYVKVLGLDAGAKAVTSTKVLIKDRALIRPIHMQMGPEGALYVLEYAGWANSNADTRIARFEYAGTCLPTALGREVRGPGARKAKLVAELGFGSRGRERGEVGLRDLKGRPMGNTPVTGVFIRD